MRRIVVVGAGGHARVVADAIRMGAQFTVHGFLDQSKDRRGEVFAGANILGGDELLDDLLRGGVEHAVVAIGDNDARWRVGEDLMKRGFRLPAVVHPAATVAADVNLGDGSLVCAGVVINPATTIGKLAIINTAASIDHDCSIGDATHIAPGAHLGGHVTVGARTLVGVGASVKPGTRIGARVTVGVGAAVVKDVADGQTVVGVPAHGVE